MKSLHSSYIILALVLYLSNCMMVLATCRKLVDASDCAVGTLNGVQLSCSWCTKESENRDRDTTGNIVESGECIDVGEQNIYEATNYTCTAFDVDVDSDVGSCRIGDSCIDGYSCHTSVTAPISIQSNNVYIVSKQCINRKMECINKASNVFTEHCIWGEKREAMYWCPTKLENRKKMKGGGFCVCASSEQNALSMIRSSTKDYTVKGELRLCKVKESSVSGELANDEIEATKASVKSSVSKQSSRVCLRKQKFQHATKILNVLYDGKDTGSPNNIDMCWMRNQWIDAKGSKPKFLSETSCARSNSHECCLRNLGTEKSNCAWCMPQNFLEKEGMIDFPEIKETLALTQWRNATKLLYNWIKKDPQSVEKSMIFFNNSK